MQALNPESLQVVAAKLEPSLHGADPDVSYQFERLGYFRADPQDHSPDAPVINRIVTLRDGWAKIEKQALQES
jgi:glutaminyl-tRNA synthetase